jgi:HSP20 family protein
MSIITRVDPFREFSVLQDRMNRLFGELRNTDVTTTGTWVPAVDIYETDEHDLVVKAELPDMTREQIEVTVENNTLTLKGERRLPEGVREDQFRRVERNYGPFRRSFTLPTTVDASRVSADYRNGVLSIKLPYREEAKPRTIAVEVSA